MVRQWFGDGVMRGRWVCNDGGGGGGGLVRCSVWCACGDGMGIW